MIYRHNYGIVIIHMGDEKPKTDEFGVTTFTIYTDGGLAYRLDRKKDSEYIFVTILDMEGRAIAKRVINTLNKENESILKLYEDYLREAADD